MPSLLKARSSRCQTARYRSSGVQNSRLSGQRFQAEKQGVLRDAKGVEISAMVKRTPKRCRRKEVRYVAFI